MGEAFISRRGGGGGSGAKVIVHAPTGSTVTCSKDGKTKTASENNGVWEFKGLDVGTWTITATLDGSTTSQEIVIANHEVTLTYSLYLYEAGQQSGWVAKAIKYSANNGPVAPTITYGADCMTVTMYTGYNYRSGVAVNGEKVDFTGFDMLRFRGSGVEGFRAAGTCRLHVWTELGETIENNLVLTKELYDEVDINLADEGIEPGSYYVGFGVGRNNSGTSSFEVNGLWLD